MKKDTTRWYSERLGVEMPLVRWGHYGTPVLLFPTAGGDAEEVERFHLIGVLGPLIDEGRIKVYSTDSIAGRTWFSGDHSAEFRARIQNCFHEFIYNEVVPAIRADCQSDDIEVIATGASIGAMNAVASVCRYPDAFRMAIAMSGTFDLSKHMQGKMTDDFYVSSPMHFLPGLEGPHLEKLRSRFILIPSGEGKWEDIGESWRLANLLGRKGIPNRVDNWGPEWHHDWITWRDMLPKYLGEFA